VRIVKTDYDEAISSAIFFIMRELGAAHDIGIEAFKTRCRPKGERHWRQNVLLSAIIKNENNV
jgi:hypothetical protein